MSAKIPAGAMAPDGFMFTKTGGVTGRRLHLHNGEPYGASMCGLGDQQSLSFASPNHTLCPACAKAVGVKVADLEVDADSAAFWKAQGF